MAHAYDPKFMDYADRSSRYAATIIGKLLSDRLRIDSVLDVGCAKGTWLDVWRKAGVETVHGVDGAYVQQEQLHISSSEFSAWDLSKGLQLGRKFALVQSLEVAEHIPEEAASTFIDNLVQHSRGIILFSAAPPGQGGEFHINEQPYDYWRLKFEKLGFAAYDYIRPLIADDTSISFWYRYNLFLYISDEIAPGLPISIRDTRVPAIARLNDVSPPMFRMRKWIVRKLPVSARDALARFKANYLPSGRW